MTAEGGEVGGGEFSGGTLKIVNRDAIKYIAMFTMVLNHIAHMFFTRGTLLYEVFEDIGFFTAPVMCFFLAEGYQYTRSKVKYGLRLFLFALLSQLPFWLAFRYQTLNMIYTLFCCFLILVVMEYVAEPMIKMVLGMLLMFATLVGDWPLLAPIFTILFRNAMGDKGRMVKAYGVAYLLFVTLNVQNYMAGQPGNWTWYAVRHALLAGAGIIVSGIVILVFYNGKRAGYGGNFSKWFFYLFYPAHLLVLCAVRAYLDAFVMT